MEIVLVLLALAAGAGLPVQASLNAALARHAGRPEWAALVNFTVGLVALAAWLAALRLAPPPVLALSRAPSWSNARAATIWPPTASASVSATPRRGARNVMAET